MRSTAAGFALALAAVTVASSGCGGEAELRPSATAPRAAELRIEQTWDQSAGLYAEGALSYIAVEDEEGVKIAQIELTENPSTLTLDPGRYRLLSWRRPCDGNCDSLDSRTDECSAPFTVMPDGPLLAKITVRAGEGCTISLG